VTRDKKITIVAGLKVSEEREAHLNARHRKFKRVKLILPALTEATSPYWRPIKYSLFPPLGLATLAAYLDPDPQLGFVRHAPRRLSAVAADAGRTKVWL
jgi:hypothetical protein